VYIWDNSHGLIQALINMNTSGIETKMAQLTVTPDYTPEETNKLITLCNSMTQAATRSGPGQVDQWLLECAIKVFQHYTEWSKTNQDKQTPADENRVWDMCDLLQLQLPKQRAFKSYPNETKIWNFIQLAGKAILLMGVDFDHTTLLTIADSDDTIA
jgi:hypothetical protein